MALWMALRITTPASAALSVMPLRDVRAGMHGIGKTVFSGNQIEDFQVEILGVLENVGPRQNIILARLSGGPLEHTGVMQGMSGSPVYIDGKLIGAVALAYPYAKDPIAGIRPIEEMLQVDKADPPGQLARIGKDSLLPMPPPAGSGIGDNRLREVSTPLSFSGFTAGALEQFAPQLRQLGLEPRQGISTGGAPQDVMGDPAKLQPGSMISVELMTGDMSAGADGTVTAIDGNKVYAFGHRFLAVGPTSLPFTRSEVITLLANVNTSFKISSARELMGVISEDRNSAVAGTLGTRAALVPLDIAVTRNAKPVETYHMKMVNDRFLSPYLLQLAVFSAIDATERATGASSIAINGSINIAGHREPVPLRSIYASEGGTVALSAIATALPLAYIMQGGFDSLKINGISLQLESFDTRRDMSIGQVYVSRKEAKAGETVELMAQLEGADGAEVTRSVKYTIPPGTAPGTLYFTVADGSQTSITELRQTMGETPHSADQLLAMLSHLRSNDKAYVRVWRPQPAYGVAGEELTDPPPSLALVLGNTQTVSQARNSKMAEFTLDAGEVMVTGTKTVQIEVKE